VRIHLERLHSEGLVERERIRQARGRPRDMWTVAPDARPGGAAPSGYEQLGRWLTRTLASSPTSPRKVEATGREIGHELAPAGNSGPAEPRMHAVLASLGFQPTREPHPPAGMTYRLCNCPYREAASESPEVVCGLHRGITRGLLDVIAPTTKLTGFTPSDPYEAGCRIKLTGGLL
jgi:predicted ArsR family transcriptional regulator